jgi:hypothetical protein
MSLIKKDDMKNHVSAHPHKRLPPFLSVKRREPIDRVASALRRKHKYADFC